MIVTDSICKGDGKILARWRYHYRLPKFIHIIQAVVTNVWDNYVKDCIAFFFNYKTILFLKSLYATSARQRINTFC